MPNEHWAIAGAMTNDKWNSSSSGRHSPAAQWRRRLDSTGKFETFGQPRARRSGAGGDEFGGGGHSNAAGFTLRHVDLPALTAEVLAKLKEAVETAPPVNGNGREIKPRYIGKVKIDFGESDENLVQAVNDCLNSTAATRRRIHAKKLSFRCI